MKRKQSKKLILLNLTGNVNETHIKEIFGSFGKLKSVQMPNNEFNPFIHDGYAFIEYAKVKYSKLALRYMNGGQIDGQFVRVELYDNSDSESYDSPVETDTEPAKHRMSERSPSPQTNPYIKKSYDENELDHPSRTNVQIDEDKLYQTAKENLRRLMYFGEISKGTEMYRLAETHIQQWDKEDKIARRSKKISRRQSDSDEEILGNSTRRRSLKKSQPIEINVRGGHRSESPEDLRFLYPVSKGYRPIINPDIPWVEVDPYNKVKRKKSRINLEEMINDKTTEVPFENEKIDQETVWPGLGLDVGILHSQRLNSLKKLEEDPDNLVALQQLESVSKLIKACEDNQTCRAPLTKVGCDDELRHLVFPDGEGLGHHLLKKMGWKPGSGLGRHEQGMIEPLAPKTQLDNKGLVSEDEKVRDITRQLVTSSPNDATSWSRTPISILNEHCWKSKRLIPKYELSHEGGPAHKKNFQYKVVIDGVTYQSIVSCGNKKEAKQVAAAVAAEAFGLLAE